MKKIATYEKVVESCKQLEEREEPVTVRKVIELVGGSTATVTPLLRKYEQQQRQEKELRYVMSESLRHALIAEMARISTTAKSDIVASLNAALEHEREILAELAEAHNKNEELTLALEGCQQQVDQVGREAEKRLAALEQKIEDLHQQQQETLLEKNQLQLTIDELRSENSKLSAQLSDRREQLKAIQEERLALTQKSDELKDRAHTQEKRADIAESKCAYADERIAELKTDLANEKERRINARKDSQ